MTDSLDSDLSLSLPALQPTTRISTLYWSLRDRSYSIQGSNFIIDAFIVIKMQIHNKNEKITSPISPNNTVYLINFYGDFTILQTYFQEDILNYLATKRNVLHNVSVRNRLRFQYINTLMAHTLH